LQVLLTRAKNIVLLAGELMSLTSNIVLKRVLKKNVTNRKGLDTGYSTSSQRLDTTSRVEVNYCFRENSIAAALHDFENH